MTPGVLFLASDDAPSRVILGAGAGVFAVTHIGETPGVYLEESQRTPETIAARFAEISDPKTAEPLKDAFGQTMKFIAAAARAKGVTWVMKAIPERESAGDSAHLSAILRIFAP